MANHSIGEVMDGAMDKIRGMVDSNAVVGEPIVTPDGITMIPVSRVSFGFASGGNDSASGKSGVWAGSGAAVKVDPIGFLMISDSNVRMVGIQLPASNTADRIIDMVPEVLDRIDRFAGRMGSSKKAPREEAE